LVDEFRPGPAGCVHLCTWGFCERRATAPDPNLLWVLQFSWYTCGRIFAKFIQAAHEANRPDQVETLKTELQSVQFALGKMGERIPVACTCARIRQSRRRCSLTGVSRRSILHHAIGHRVTGDQGNIASGA
jgi:hypothetical protein